MTTEPATDHEQTVQNHGDDHSNDIHHASEESHTYDHELPDGEEHDETNEDNQENKQTGFASIKRKTLDTFNRYAPEAVAKNPIVCLAFTVIIIIFFGYILEQKYGTSNQLSFGTDQPHFGQLVRPDTQPAKKHETTMEIGPLLQKIPQGGTPPAHLHESHSPINFISVPQTDEEIRMERINANLRNMIKKAQTEQTHTPETEQAFQPAKEHDPFGDH